MRDITDDKTLAHYISIDIAASMKKIQLFLEEKIRKSVLEIVYHAGEPAVYQRNFHAGGFYGSWRTTKIEVEEGRGGRSWTTKLFSDPKLLTYNPDLYMHGSPGLETTTIKNWGVFTSKTGEINRTENLDQYIAEGTDYDWPKEDWVGSQNEGVMASYNFWWLQARDYWTPMMDWWVTAGGIGAEFAQVMMDIGVTFDFGT